MRTRGRHLLVEYHGCDATVLDDRASLTMLLERAAEAAGATVVQSVFHRFSPHGVTGVVVVEESHLSIHTWPEAGYAAVDVYTCGECVPEQAHHVLFEGLGAESAEVMSLERGLTSPGRGIAVARHRRERPRADDGVGATAHL